MEGTEKLATFIAGATWDSLPRPAIETAKKSVLDCIGVALAGSTEDGSRIMTDFVRELGGNPLSTVFAGGFRTSPPWAALNNGAMAHALDFDDVSKKMSHSTVTLLPTVLALGEVKKSSGKQILQAFLVGFETWAKVASAMPGHSEKGWHSSATFGSLGAAAAAAKILGLDKEKVKMALSIASCQAGGSKRQFGTMTKPFHAGEGAKNGVLAAMLAARGFTADPTILEGKYGFCELYAGENEKVDLAAAMKEVGDFYNILNLGIGFKPYPCRATNHSGIDAALYLVGQNPISPEDVESIDCAMDRTIDIGYAEVKTPLEAKFSLPFCLAVSIVDRKAGLPQFTEEKVHDPKIQGLIKRVTLRYDPDLTPGVKNTGSATIAVVTIKLKDGKVYSHRVNKAKGTTNVPMSKEDLVEKYKACASMILSETKIQKSLELIDNIEDLKDINELTALLA